MRDYLVKWTTLNGEYFSDVIYARSSVQAENRVLATYRQVYSVEASLLVTKKNTQPGEI